MHIIISTGVLLQYSTECWRGSKALHRLRLTRNWPWKKTACSEIRLKCLREQCRTVLTLCTNYILCMPFCICCTIILTRLLIKSNQLYIAVTAAADHSPFAWDALLKSVIISYAQSCIRNWVMDSVSLCLMLDVFFQIFLQTLTFQSARTTFSNFWSSKCY